MGYMSCITQVASLYQAKEKNCDIVVLLPTPKPIREQRKKIGKEELDRAPGERNREKIKSVMNS